MTTYKGPAVMWLPGGRQFAASVNLHKDPAGSWQGTLVFPTDPHFPVLLNVREGALQVDGAYGDFVRPDTSDWAATPGDLFQMRILGNGDAPF